MNPSTLIICIIATLKLPVMEAGGCLDLNSKWWSKDVGSSGVYLTSEFSENVSIPVTKTIIQMLDHLRKKQTSQNSFYKIMGAALGVKTVIMVGAYWILNNKK